MLIKYNMNEENIINQTPFPTETDFPEICEEDQLEEKGAVSSDFKRVREKTAWIWRNTTASNFCRHAIRIALYLAIPIGFVAVILPMGGTLLTIAIVGLVILGVSGFCYKKEWWQKTKDKVCGLITDLFVVGGFALRFPLALRRNKTERKDYRKNEVKETRLVVYVHGFLHNKSYGVHASKDLLKSEKTRRSEDPITEKDIYSVNLAPRVITYQSIDEYARFLATKLEKIHKGRGLDKEKEKLKVIFVCHSMGGLAVGQFAKEYSKKVPVDIRRIITNGTPWHGTKIARVMPSFVKCANVSGSSIPSGSYRIYELYC